MSKPRILIIDDDHTILEMLRIALNRADFEALPATDGDIGLRLFRDEQPDLVIVDVAMPGMDGYDVVERIRAGEPPEQPTPIIMLTAHNQPVMRDYASELGADLYLAKPIAPKELVDHIRKLLPGMTD
jgi:DNA-binding response OmpR family regulator